MNTFTPLSFFRLTLFVALLSAVGYGQSVSFNYLYKPEPAMIDAPPVIGELTVDFPEQARKNGVEGTAVAKLVLGEDGKVRGVSIINDLPHGVGAALVTGLQKLYFKPATFRGTPVAINMTVDYKVSIEYTEDDKNVDKVKILEKPTPVYPEKYRADKVKGKVDVLIRFGADGTMRIISVGSTMEREFDKAANEAARGIKFQPAVHKKSKSPVNQQITVSFDFKP